MSRVSTSEIENRVRLRLDDSMSVTSGVEREILLAFWKVHILHHAGEEPIIGQWILRELQRHGYQISPGTLYPLLARLERRGWLSGRVEAGGGLRSPKAYRLTAAGRSVLALLRAQIEELYREVVLGEEEAGDLKHPPARSQSAASPRKSHT